MRSVQPSLTVTLAVCGWRVPLHALNMPGGHPFTCGALNVECLLPVCLCGQYAFMPLCVCICSLSL